MDWKSLGGGMYRAPYGANKPTHKKKLGIGTEQPSPKSLATADLLRSFDKNKLLYSSKPIGANTHQVFGTPVHPKLEEFLENVRKGGNFWSKTGQFRAQRPEIHPFFRGDKHKHKCDRSQEYSQFTLNSVVLADVTWYFIRSQNKQNQWVCFCALCASTDGRCAHVITKFQGGKLQALIRILFPLTRLVIRCQRWYKHTSTSSALLCWWF